MSSSAGLAVRGATGYTGALVWAEARSLGAPLWLAGGTGDALVSARSRSAGSEGHVRGGLVTVRAAT